MYKSRNASSLSKTRDSIGSQFFLTRRGIARHTERPAAVQALPPLALLSHLISGLEWRLSPRVAVVGDPKRKLRNLLSVAHGKTTSSVLTVGCKAEMQAFLTWDRVRRDCDFEYNRIQSVWLNQHKCFHSRQSESGDVSVFNVRHCWIWLFWSRSNLFEYLSTQQQCFHSRRFVPNPVTRSDFRKPLYRELNF